jgi:iron complex outermembrane receptor protein
LKLESDFNNVQPFVEYEWKPTDQLSITPGYKYESFTRIHNAAVNQTTLQTMSYATTYQANLPFLTARYKVNDQWTVYGQASQGFLVPTVSAYYVFNPAQSNIQPQSTTNYQIGAVYKTRDLTADVAIYQQRAANFPVTDTFKSGPYVGQTFYYNGGTAQYRGAEFQGTWAFGRQIGWEGWAVSSAVGISNAVYTQGANAHLAVGDAPDYTIAGGVLYDDKTFFGSLLQKFVGPYYGAQGQRPWVTYSATGVPTYTNAGLNRVPGYNSTDIVAGYRYKLPDGFAYGYGKQIEFKIGVQNLLDHRAITEISGKPDGLTSINNTTLGYQFQSGRYIYGAVKYDF